MSATAIRDDARGGTEPAEFETATALGQEMGGDPLRRTHGYRPLREKRLSMRFAVAYPSVGRCRSSRYLPCQFGGRFSAKARGPSMKSWLLDSVATDS